MENGFAKAADQVRADVIYAAYETALPTPDTPAPVKIGGCESSDNGIRYFIMDLRISGVENAHVEEYFYPGKPLQTDDMVRSG